MNPRRTPRPWSLACLSILLFPVSVLAADKALIVAVGKYVDTSINLPGIGFDVQNMRQVALDMGLSNAQIHTLLDERASLAAIESELRGWFREGVGPEDRLLLYFSGHGSIVKGPNGLVGALIPHDVRKANSTLENVLTGPALAGLLEGNTSKHILLVVDACHSGGLTAAKGISPGRFTPKVLVYDGMPTGDLSAGLLKAGVPATKDVTELNYAYLSACRRDQVAAATNQGSLFTIALAEGWKNLRQSKQHTSLEAVQPITTELIKANGMNDQSPELYGESTLLKADWFKATPQTSLRPKPSEYLEQVAKGASGSFPARISRQEYTKADTMEISIEAPREGYLFVLSIGEGDENPTVLFPNKLQGDNRIKPGPIQIPKTGATWHIRQGLPPKVSRQNVLLVLVLTRNQVNLQDLMTGEGDFKQLRLPEDKARSPFVEEDTNKAGYLAARITYVIKE
jgi:metacaspase-1